MTINTMPKDELDAVVLTIVRTVQSFRVIIHSAKLELYTTVGERIFVDAERDHDTNACELSVTCDDENGGLHTILKCGIASGSLRFSTVQLIKGAIEARYA